MLAWGATPKSRGDVMVGNSMSTLFRTLPATVLAVWLPCPLLSSGSLAVVMSYTPISLSLQV